jgi:excisionase family DNA binding protein
MSTSTTTLPEIISAAAEGPELHAVARALEGRQAVLVDAENHRVSLPDPVYRVLFHALRFLERGEGVLILPSSQELTTQDAANMVGISRQYFVQLLEQGRIPFHKVGTHRRVHLRDLLEYRKQREAGRRKMLDEIAQEAVADGVYDVIPPTG